MEGLLGETAAGTGALLAQLQVCLEEMESTHEEESDLYSPAEDELM